MKNYKQSLIIFMTCLISLSLGVYYGYKISIQDTHEYGLRATYSGLQFGDKYEWEICNYNMTVCTDILMDVSRGDGEGKQADRVYIRNVYFKEDVDLLFEYYQLAEKLKLSRYLRR